MVQRTTPRITQEIRGGNAKVASQYVTIPSGETEFFLIEAPDSDVRAEVLDVSVSVGGACLVESADGVTVDSRGSPMNVSNLKTSENDSSNITFEYGGSYSNVSYDFEEYLPGGDRISTATGSKGTGRRIIVSSNDTFLMRLTNLNSQSSVDLSVDITFVEKDVS